MTFCKKYCIQCLLLIFFKDMIMKNFTYYEAEKFLKEVAQGQDLDIDNFNLSEFSNAKEVSKLLDVSESTANNWLAGRTDVSKLGEQAIGYQLMINMVEAYKNTPKSNILVQNQEEYSIYSESENGTHELLATTQNPKLARTIKEIKKVYRALVLCEKFMTEELETREDHFSAEELQPYNIELTNLRDVIAYIAQGKSISQKREEILNKCLNIDIPPIDLQSNTTKDNKNKEILELKKEASDALEKNKRIYYDTFPIGTIFKHKTNKYIHYVKKISENEYRPEREEANGIIITNYPNNAWKTYSGPSSAFQNTWGAISVPRDTQYSIDDGKSWIDTRKAEMTESQYSDFVYNKILKELGV